MASAAKNPVKLLYVTCKDLEQARSIGRDLISERLAACVNILPGMESHYRWDGMIETATESVMIVKTTATLALKCSERVKSIHSYETPCVLELDVTGGNENYISWLRDQVL